MMRKFVGNYEMNLEVSGAGHLVKVFFSANEDLSKRAYLEITSNGFNVVREIADRRWVCKEYPGVGTPPLEDKSPQKRKFLSFLGKPSNRVDAFTPWRMDAPHR